MHFCNLEEGRNLKRHPMKAYGAKGSPEKTEKGSFSPRKCIGSRVRMTWKRCKNAVETM